MTVHILGKIKERIKKLWYRISPTAHNFVHLKEQLNMVTALLEKSDAIRRSDVEELIRENGIALKSDLLDVARQSDLLRDTDVLEILQQSGLLHRAEIQEILQQSGLLHRAEMPEILQQSGLLHLAEMQEILQQSGLLHRAEMQEILQQSEIVQKTDIPDMVRQCVDLPQIVKEYIWNHQMDSASVEPNTELYNSYKWLETHHLPEFIRTRFAHNVIGYELKKIADQHPDKHIYILTDFPDYDFPYQAITLDRVLDYAGKEDSFFVLLYRFDWNAIKTVRFFDEHGLKYQAPSQIVPMARYLHTNQLAYETLMDEQSNDPRIHYCPIDFENIFQGLEATRALPGDYVEIGTYQGASARAALNYMRRAGIHRNAYFLDTFEGFTYEGAQKSSDAAWYGTHTETSLDMVEKYLSEYDNARLIKSNIITNGLPDEITQIALCNIDVDIYDAVYESLRKVSPLIVKHGIIIAEDYGHTPWLIGAQYAVKRFLDETSGFMPLYFPSGQIMLIKIV